LLHDQLALIQNNCKLCKLINVFLDVIRRD